MSKKPADGRKVIATNRKARHNYSIIDVYEAGVQLVGTEVKTLREGKASLVDAFATVDDGEVDICKGLRDEIEKRSDIKSVRFVNREDAYADAGRRLPQFQDLMKDVSKDAFPASFIVKLKDPEKHADFDEAFVGKPGVRGVLNQKDLIDRLFAVLDSLRDAAFMIALIQAVGAVLLIANMVQVAAYTRRTEVGIMRLVGATRWYTQLPFLLEAVIAALAGVALAVIGLIIARVTILNGALQQFIQANLVAPITYGDVFLAAIQMAALGILLAGVTAYVTLRLYVRR
ncbi:Cell division protein FtsX homolog [Mycobacteroides abscessus subsp. abscessus]|nr:Cell division protein FtsX homolog [Mycobacteroides abscessus subsp. abscessus]